MADASPPRVNAGIAALLKIASDLRGLPRPEFKTRLKADLKKSITAHNRAKTAPQARSHGVATPYLMIRDASRAIDFYKRAFGATELMRMAEPGGRLAHAEIQIGDAPIMIAEEAPGYFNVSPQSLGGSSAFVHVYVDDIDAFARQAERGGAKVLEAPQDYPYGDRRGKFVDPFGHVWMVATHKHDVTAEQMKADWDRSVAAEKASKAVPKPEGFHSITPYLQVNGAAQLIDFLKRAFNAEEVMRVNLPDGTIGHAQMKVSGSMIELADASDQFKPNPTAIWLFVDDADSAYKQALAAGATSLNEPADQDYGNREAGVRDPFGNHWYIATPLPSANPRPPELRTVTPYLHPKGAARLMDYLKDAFGAEELARFADDAGVVHHAQLKIGDSIIAMGEAHEPYGPMPPALHLYVSDTDATYRSALRAGAKSMYAPRDEAYGDRSGGVTDPFGNVWYIATHQHPEKLSAIVSESRSAAQARETPSSARKAEVHFQVSDAAKLIDFIKSTFGADEIVRHKTGEGAIAHAELGFDGSIVTAGDLSGDQKPMPTAIHLYVPDADAAYRRALEAGSISIHEPIDMEYGERGASVTDPFGNNWYLATSFKAREPGAPEDAYVPAGLPRAIPALHPKGAPALIDFLKNAFGAIETLRAETSDGTVAHAKLRIGQSMIELGEAHGPYQPHPTAFHIYVDDTDAAYRRALAAGAVSIDAPADQPYGYRNAGVRDPGGNEWRINAPLHAEEKKAQSTNLESRPAIMPFMYCEDVGAAANFYKRVFEAKELHRELEQGRASHVQLEIGGTPVMLSDATMQHTAEGVAKGYVRTPHQLGGTPLHLYVYVPDADAAFRRALDSGSEIVNPMEDQQWGDRCGGVKDPFGHIWYIATPLKDVRH